MSGGGQCEAVNKRGEPCGMPALIGERWCGTFGHREKVLAADAAQRPPLLLTAGPPRGGAPPGGGVPPGGPPPGGGSSDLSDWQDVPASLYDLPAAPPPEDEPVATNVPPEPDTGSSPAEEEEDDGIGLSFDWSDAETGDLIADTLDVLFEAGNKRKVSKAGRTRLGKAWGPIARRYLGTMEPGGWGTALMVTGMEVGVRYPGEIIGGAMRAGRVVGSFIAGRGPRAAHAAPPETAGSTTAVEVESVDVDGPPPGARPVPDGFSW